MHQTLGSMKKLYIYANIHISICFHGVLSLVIKLEIWATTYITVHTLLQIYAKCYENPEINDLESNI